MDNSEKIKTISWFLRQVTSLQGFIKTRSIAGVDDLLQFTNDAFQELSEEDKLKYAPIIESLNAQARNLIAAQLNNFQLDTGSGTAISTVNDIEKKRSALEEIFQLGDSNPSESIIKPMIETALL